ncbi:MAG TPA: hypothetical protein VFG20_03900 [Planctomycetaceae bacterium]|nr:hypothetical protein [Planctomycetaceae bacterium]
MAELNGPPNAVVPAVELRRLNFAYPTGRKVLTDISATWSPGTRGAIVRPCGAG